MRPFGILIAVLALALGASSAAWAEDAGVTPLTIGPDFREAQVIRYAELLRDPTQERTIEQVSRPPWSERFKPCRKDSISYGLSSDSYWFRFRLADGRDGFPSMVLAVTRPLVSSFEVFLPLREGPPDAFRHLRAGFSNYAHGDDLGHRLRAVALPTDIRPEAYVYVRVRSVVATYALTLFSNRAFEEYTRFEYLFFGLCTGVILAMLLYNLFVAAFLRDRAYAAYCAYLAAMIPYSSLLTGWPLGMGLPPAYLTGYVLKLCAASFFFAALFARVFLNTKGRHPIIDRFLIGVMILAVADFTLDVIGFFEVANAAAYIMGMVVPVVMVVSGVVMWRARFVPARYYLAAWGVLMASAMVYAASGIGLVDYSFIVYNMVLIGATVESILLALALGDRIRVMRAERAKLQQKERRLTELSITDELTGLFNKRWFSSKLHSEIQHARRLGLHLSLLVVDVDHFKRFNDDYGHIVGDRILAKLGSMIRETVRNQDIPCRYGGEEFAVILTEVDRNQAVRVGERLRTEFADSTVQVNDKKRVGATVSVGVTQLIADDTPEAMFNRADQALYQAKTKGRNQVVSLP